MRRILAFFLVMVMCLSFVGGIAYGEDIVTENPVNEPAPEMPAAPESSPSPEVPLPDPPIPPQEIPGSQEQPSNAEEPWSSPDEQTTTPDSPNIPEQPPIPEEKKEIPEEPSEDKPEEEHGLPEDSDHGETASEAPADETEETPVLEPEKPESQLTLTLDCNISGFIAGRPETAALRAVVTRSDAGLEFPSAVAWESSDPNIRIVPQNETTEDALTKTFYATAEYSGVLGAESADITVSVPELGSRSITIKVSHDQFKAVIKDETGTGFIFALKNRSENTFNAGSELTFVFTDSEKNADKDRYRDFVWEAYMEAADGSGEYPVHVKNEENGEFTLYTDAGFTTRHSATGDVRIALTGKTADAFPVTVYGNEECKTVFLTGDQTAKGEDYIFYVAHPEDLEFPEETVESEFLYFPPLVTIGGKEFNGYELAAQSGNTIPGVKETYKRFWKITIPAKTGDGEAVIDGPVIIKANTHKKPEEGDVVYPVTVSLPAAQLAQFPVSATSFPDPEDKENQEYYFYFIKNPADDLHPIYFMNDESHPLTPLPVWDKPEAEGSRLYRISDITAPVTVALGYNVSLAPMEKTIERLFTLPKETVNQGEDYTFTVRTFDMTETQLPVTVSTPTRQIYPALERAEQTESVTWKQGMDEFGSYAVFTVPHSLITGDITIGTTRTEPVNYRIRFIDAYNAGMTSGGESLEYKAFEFKSDYYNRDFHMAQYVPGADSFSFEILEMPYYMSGSSPNADGTVTDAFLARYKHETTGYGFYFTDADGNPVPVIQGPYLDGRQLYTVKGDFLTGDVVLKVYLDLPKFELRRIASSEEKFNSMVDSSDITNRETFLNRNGTTTYVSKEQRSSPVPTYRYRFELKTKPGQARAVYLSVYNAWDGTFTKYTPRRLSAAGGSITAQLYGDAVEGTVYAKVLANDELDVFVTGGNANHVLFPNNAKDDCAYYNGCIAKMGEDFVFTVPNDTRISQVRISNSNQTYRFLTEGQDFDFTVDGNVRRYTIPGKYMTDDIRITTAVGRAYYNVIFTGKYEFALPVDKDKVVQKDIVRAGEDYRFFVADEGVVSITIGGRNDEGGANQLRKNKDYNKLGMLITIPARIITDDIYINVSLAVHKKTPVYASKKKAESGTELDIETWQYLVLDEEKIMYMLVVHADPQDGEFICYNNHKMLWVESYDGYVWFEESEERPEDFTILSYDMVDALTDEMIRSNLAAEAEDPDAPIELPEFEKVYNITDDGEISCDVNEDGKVDEEDLKIMRRIFNCDFEDFEDIPMRCFVLADADNSGVLDMCDAEIIKCNFDKSEEE